MPCDWRRLPHRRRRPAFDEQCRTGRTAQRPSTIHAQRLDARDAGDGVQQPRDERGRIGRWHPRFRRNHPERQHTFGIDADIDLPHPPDAVEQQSRGDDEQRGERRFDADDDATSRRRAQR